MNKTVNCVIIDDEPLAINVIKNHLQHFSNYKIIGSFNQPVTAFDFIQQNPVDVIFLDINMPDINGLELIKNLKNKPLVVVTTAYREFAIESFEIGVLDYLVKPISLKRFMKTIDRINNRIFDNNSKQEKNYFFVKANKKLIKLFFDDIIYIESLRDYIQIVTKNDRILVLSSMNAFLKQLPADKFLRIHRSYIINTSKVTSIDGNLIELPEKKIPIGRNYINEVKKVILS